MITIGTFLHRKEFNDLVWRWFHNYVKPDDPEHVTRLVMFNKVFVSKCLDLWSLQLFDAMFKTHPHIVPIKTKAELKDALVAYPHYHNKHIDDLIRNYVQHRERYYIETPIHGKLFFSKEDSHLKLIGSQRIKRGQRLAEKSARRIIDMLFAAIKRRAEDYADLRAQKYGIPRQSLVTSPEEMIREFERAEERIIEDLREGVHFPKISAPPIYDAAGLKLILNPEDEDRLFRFLETRTRCNIFEVEKHVKPNYRATNLIIKCYPKKELLLEKPLDKDLIAYMRNRGLWQGNIQKEYEEFILTGEDEFYLEIIYSTFEDILNSEIGESMHEERITNQRQNQAYSGHLARNIESLVQYIFKFASFPSPTLKDVPIKVWTRYLPDYFSEVNKILYGIKDPGDFIY